MKKILVIDDDREVCDFIHDLLDATGGYQVIAALTGHAGLKAVHKYHPDLVLLDIDLPDMSGMKALKQLCEMKDAYFIPVIMLTGFDSEELKTQANEDYADGYVVKPFEPKELMTRIRQVLEHHHGSFVA